jgi:hypothetical protein
MKKKEGPSVSDDWLKIARKDWQRIGRAQPKRANRVGSRKTVKVSSAGNSVPDLGASYDQRA